MQRWFIVVTAALLFVGGCTPSAPPPLTGDQVAASLAPAGLPVANVRVFTADTDPNQLLGRPQQYTAKVSWFDQRVSTQDGLTEANVEVFPDTASLGARDKYTRAISGAVGGLAQYVDRNDARRVLLRLPHDLTPDQAAEYQTWLKAL